MPRIAVIDKDETLVYLAGELFLDEGWQALPILDSDSALATIQNSHPDVIVLDLWLDCPTSGWAILRQLRADARTRYIPVIIWTGASDLLAEKQSWLEAWGIRTVTKPCEIDDLLTTVRTALASGGRERARSLAAV